MAKSRGLGKGLDALFADTGAGSDDPVRNLRLSEIEPNRSQPRKDFDDEALAELSDSIAKHGVLQPLLVRPTASGVYQIVAGERRWRAARMAGISEVPVLIRELSDEETDQMALIENLQREDLNAVETAEGYKRLMEKYGMTQEALSEAVGKSRPAIANMLRLLTLPKDVLSLLRDGTLSAGHAKAILSAPEASRSQLAERVIKEGLSVRETEKLASKPENPKKAVKKESFPKNSFYREMQVAMKEELGRPVRITEGKNGGFIEIPFYNEDELKAICAQLTKIHK